MVSSIKKTIWFFVIYIFISGCSKKTTQHLTSKPTNPKREFRGVWIATIDNIDFPSKKGLPSQQQQEEFKKLLDFQRGVGMNAILMQVRAAADAFYAKSEEPWSEWLTGTQGKAPEPFYDPMQFMIEETHARGMEFHAWLNMNRGTHKVSKSVMKNHITFTKPEWFLSYGGYKLFNLGIPEVRQYIKDVVMNIARNYDVDGIHFDDYFYPYAVPNEKLMDEVTFKKYPNNIRNIDDWRRNNVDLLVKDISESLKREKPKLKFGISPFGVWRNANLDKEGSQTFGGLTSYDNLYADTRKWVKEGWIDYIAPQIYFSFEFDKVPYKNLADWWLKNAFDRHLYIGQGVYRVKAGSKEVGWENAGQLPKQIQYNRSHEPISGSIYFSAKSLIKNELGMTDSLRRNYYSTPALMPTMKWKDDVLPNRPENLKAKRLKDVGVLLTWEVSDKLPKDKEDVHSFVVYRFSEKEPINLENSSNILQVIRNQKMYSFIDKTAISTKKYNYVVTSLDRLQNESPMSNMEVVK